MNKLETTNQSEIEKVMKKVYYEFDTAVSYKIWVKNFALNLENIWKEKSAKKLTENTVSDSVIVIGRGPSLKNHDHLNKLKSSNLEYFIYIFKRICFCISTIFRQNF